MYLTNCPENNYFIVEELWFHYKEREEYSKLGLVEGTIIFVEEKTENNILVKTDLDYISLTEEDASNVYGNVYIKSKSKSKKR